MRTYIRATIEIRLEEEEKFRFRTPTGPIMVDHIMVHTYQDKSHHRDFVTCYGSAIKRDGTLALINRQGRMDLRDLPQTIKEEAQRALSSTEPITQTEHLP